jgi:hypothetical protein
MSTDSAEEIETAPSGFVPEFTIEADHPRNCDLLIQAIPGLRLRGSVDGSRHTIDAKSGDTRVPIDQARALASFPRTPGMHLTISTRRAMYRVSDPLYKNEALLNRISQHFKESGRGAVQVNGVAPTEGALDRDRMKTLCRELIELAEMGHIKVVAGALPNADEIEDLPGQFLLNPGSRVQNTQPRYERDYEEWVSKLSHGGG